MSSHNFKYLYAIYWKCQIKFGVSLARCIYSETSGKKIYEICQHDKSRCNIFLRNMYIHYKYKATVNFKYDLQT